MAGLADEVSVGDAKGQTAASMSPDAVSVRRVGSPFAPAGASGSEGGIVGSDAAGRRSGASSEHAYVPVRQAAYSPTRPSEGGAIAALILALLSLLISMFSATAVVTALVGLGLGLWALSSSRRTIALVALLLCCLALAIGGYRGVVAWHIYQYGYSPWQQAPATEYQMFRPGNG